MIDWKGCGNIKGGKQIEFRNDTSGHPGAGVAGRDSDMASQQDVGLWSQRGPGLDFSDRPDSSIAGQNMTRQFIAPSRALTTGAIQYEHSHEDTVSLRV
jgi:hypothetical protein